MDSIAFDVNGSSLELKERTEAASISCDEAGRPFVTVEEDILGGVPREDWVRTVKDDLRKRSPNRVAVGHMVMNVPVKNTPKRSYGPTSFHALSIL